MPVREDRHGFISSLKVAIGPTPPTPQYVTKRLITNDATLRKYIPNAFTTAEGESLLFTKLDPYLLSAEKWVKGTFAIQHFENIVDYATETPPRPYMAKVIVDQALLTAIPSLDLVLTPNGFGIVSNSNVAPASKERAERLLAAVEKDRDLNIHLTLLHLKEVDAWFETLSSKFFGATLFPDLSLCDYLGIKEHKWDAYLEKRAELIAIEQSLANEYISPELMAAFRREGINRYNASSPDRRFLIQTLRFHEVAMMQGKLLNRQAMMDIANIIRSDATNYPEWQNTATAALFSPNKFENTKDAGGYWF